MKNIKYEEKKASNQITKMLIKMKLKTDQKIQTIVIKNFDSYWT